MMDVADAAVLVEGLRCGAGPDVEDGGVVELGIAGAVFLFIANLVILLSLVTFQLDQK